MSKKLHRAQKKAKKTTIGTVIEAIKKAVLFGIKWRFVIAAAALVFGVVFKLHGSSIAEYNKLFENQASYDESSIIVGASRGIRGDEYLVNTPYYLSQGYNGYSEDSYIMSMSGQNMTFSTNAPVRSVLILATPFNWGFVLFGSEYGLSWYWCSKIIVMLLASFEFCLILTKRNKKAALLGMLMMTYAPPVQWWFSSSVIDILAFGMAIFSFGYYFFVAGKRWQKNLLAFVLPITAVAFAISLYPAMQVPVGLLMVALLVSVLLRDKKSIRFEKKKDIIRICAMLLIGGGLLGYALYSGMDALKALGGTAYPGRRVSLGGDGGMQDLFTNITTFTLPYKSITFSNNCEASRFIHLAPVFMILYAAIYKKNKNCREMIVGNILLVSLIVFAVFYLIGFPELMAKITLFSYIHRASLPYGFCATAFTVWGVSMVLKGQKFSYKQTALVLGIYAFACACMVGGRELTYLAWWQYAVIIAGLLAICYFLLRGYNYLFLLSMSMLMLVSGLLVNPIAKGTTPLTGHPLEQKINEIASENPDAYWLSINYEESPDGAASDSGVLASMSVANGARTLNMVNFYPDFEKWEILDPEGEQNEVFNRYAHIIVFLEEDNSISVGSAGDIVRLGINCEGLSAWNVDYLITSGEITICEDEFEQIYDDEESNYFIYEREK